MHHSDQGVQYRDVRYGQALVQCKAVASVGSRGDSYDNALDEALNSLHKGELIYNKARPGYAGLWHDRREVERETAAWAHWYNNKPPPSPSAATPHNKQKTNTQQQEEKKHPKQPTTKPRN